MFLIQQASKGAKFSAAPQRAAIQGHVCPPARCTFPAAGGNDNKIGGTKELRRDRGLDYFLIAVALCGTTLLPDGQSKPKVSRLKSPHGKQLYVADVACAATKHPVLHKPARENPGREK